MRNKRTIRLTESAFNDLVMNSVRKNIGRLIKEQSEEQYNKMLRYKLTEVLTDLDEKTARFIATELIMNCDSDVLVNIINRLNPEPYSDERDEFPRNPKKVQETMVDECANQIANEIERICGDDYDGPDIEDVYCGFQHYIWGPQYVTRFDGYEEDWKKCIAQDAELKKVDSMIKGIVKNLEEKYSKQIVVRAMYDVEDCLA